MHKACGLFALFEHLDKFAELHAEGGGYPPQGIDICGFGAGFYGGEVAAGDSGEAGEDLLSEAAFFAQGSYEFSCFFPVVIHRQAPF